MTIQAIFEAIAPVIVSKAIEICYDVVKGLICKGSPEKVKEESVESNRTGKKTRHQQSKKKK